MNNAEAFVNKHQVFVYEIKDGTKTSYNLIQGEKGILPERLSFMIYDGRNGVLPAKYQIHGKYKLEEDGLYYSMNNRIVHTKIIESKSFPQFVGYGEIDQRFKVYDLVIIYSTNQCKKNFEVHLFKGFGFPEYLNSAFNYVLTKDKRENSSTEPSL